MLNHHGAHTSGIAYHLSILHTKVDDIAERAGVSASERHDVESSLAALPWPARRRLGLVLDSVEVHAHDPALHEAVRTLRLLAAKAWAEAALPSRGLS